ncbi:MAG: hypothetical protein RIF33_21665 [Cyclobacteriaceae bacterium]
MLLISAMTLADTRAWVFELDEIIEGREIEKEELKEGSEVAREWYRLLSAGGLDFIPSDPFLFKSVLLHYSALNQSSAYLHTTDSRAPLFILHCSLKIHLG